MTAPELARGAAEQDAADPAPGVGTEALLRAAAAGGDRAAFAVLYQTYREDILRYLTRRCRGDRHLAEDLTQDTFARAFSVVAGYRETGRPFGAWLVRIAANLLVDYWRSAWYRRHVPHARFGLKQDENAALLPGGIETDPGVTVVAREEQRRAAETLAQSVAALTERQRQVLELRFLAGRSVTETAEILGLAEGAVKAATYRARLSLATDPTVAGLRQSA
jgi:RNA polymerase sigma-70 factor (ECF subfamily)